jgi:hypothetical protein
LGLANLVVNVGMIHGAIQPLGQFLALRDAADIYDDLGWLGVCDGFLLD